jgi:hypothetical protein
MKTNITVKEYIESINYCSLNSIKKTIEDYISKYGENAELVIDSGPVTDTDYYILFNRLETDEEYDKRLKRDEELKKIRRQQYENLKKEFDSE